ncbi:MAG TPA: choice-of-anchor B family protein [Bacteroidetes bacterium]|nr:choice-of-anchor B family protein [Bacteroidota bacterium]
MARSLFVVLLTLAFVAPAEAQTPCVENTADGFPCNRIGLWSRLPVSTFSSPGTSAPSSLNDIWGWTDETSGREFALVGATNGLAFVEITDPAAPVYLGKLPTATTASTWRDVKVYADHAFVVSEAFGHGMQVFDLSRLLSVSSPPVTFSSDARYTGFGSAHNVVIDETSGFAFGVGVSAPTCGGGGLHMVDIRTPTSPTYAGCFDDDGYTHDAQCLVYEGPDTEHQGRQICVASNEDTITVVDVTDKSNPVELSRGFYPNPGYTHQGWFTEDQRYFVVNDEVDNSAGPRTIIFDLADLDSPSFEFIHFRPVATTDHNLYIRGDYAFLSNYEAGLRIYDATRLATNRFDELAFFDTYPQGDRYTYNGQWSNYPYFESGVVIANDQDNGLFVLAPDPSFFAVSGEEAPVTVPDAGFLLTDPAPNPFTDRVTFELAVDATQHIRAEVFDVQGRRVVTLLDRVVTPNTVQPLALDAGDLPAGTYVVRVTGETFAASRSVSLTR